MRKIVVLSMLLSLIVSFTHAEWDDDATVTAVGINNVQSLEVKPIRTTFNAAWMREMREPLTKEMLDERAEKLREDSKERMEKIKEDAKTKRDNIKAMSKEKIEDFRNNLKEVRKNKNELIKNNKEQAKENLKVFRDENKWEFREILWELDQETKDSLRDLEEQFKNESQIIRDSIKENFTDDELRKELLEELQNLRKAFYEDAQEKLWDNDDALWLLAERKDVFLENEELRRENAKARVEYRWEISDLVSEQKTKLLDRIKFWLDNADNAKLERLLAKLDEISERFEKANISDDKKQEIQAKIIALKEIIEEKLDANLSSDTELDLESLLDFEWIEE